jgi:transcription termination factor Rho
MTGDSLEYTEQLIQFLRKTKNNDQFFEEFQDVSFGSRTPRRNQKR